VQKIMTHLIKNSRGNIQGQMTECDTCNAHTSHNFAHSHPMNCHEYAVIAESATGQWKEILWLCDACGWETDRGQYAQDADRVRKFLGSRASF
jgi:hypothetical protein